MNAHGVFDSEALRLMQTALERALVALPPDQRTAETRERVAQAVLSLVMHWERDPEELGLDKRARAFLGVG
jgi:hypothetical protein